MSGRKLGGGRVLGNGRSLSPAVSPLPKQNPALLSPSPSSISVSSTSTSHTSQDNQDIASKISAGTNGAPNPAAVAAASSKLACPICNEEMVRGPTREVDSH